MFTTLMQDVRYSLRQLRKTPAFTTTAVLTLALGIGANAAIFTIVNAMLLKDLPVADPKSLVRIGDHDDCCVGVGIPDDGDYSLFSTDSWEQFRKNAPEFEDLAAIQAGFSYRPVIVRRDGTQENARSVMGEFVSGNYFRTLGLRPERGRLFSDADDVKGAPIAAVMSYDTWKNSYSADPSIVGSTFFVNTRPVTIAGITPAAFFGDRILSTPPDFYLPIESMPLLANTSYVHDPDTNWLYMIGRVKPGVSVAQLQAKLSGLLQQSLAPTRTFSSLEHKKLLPKMHVVLTPGGAGIQHLQDDTSGLQLVMWIAGMVLLIACANIANLLLVRGMGRKAEMSVRTALGAMHSRIIRQLLTESVVLAGLSGLAALAVAYGGTRFLLALAFPGATDLPIQATPSPAVLAFACGLSLLTGILCGMAPAWIAARTEPADALRSGSRTTTGGATLLQRGLVVTQAALSLVLLVGAGLFSQSLNKLQTKDLKLESRNRYIVHINPQAAGYSQRQVGDLYRTIEERFHALPAVDKVGIATYTPMEDNNDGWGVQLEGQADLNVQASDVKATAEYFDSVGTSVVLGRGIRVQDTPASTIVAVVNQSFVKKLFKPGENPIGRHFGTGPKHLQDYEIVGVVEDTAYTSARWKDHAMYFVPMLQRPASDTGPIEDDEMMYAGAVVLKTAQPIGNMEALARQTLSAINPNLAVVKFQTFDQQIADRFIDDRMLARLTMLFGLLALLLAAIGLYGVTAYGVSRRTSEIGIRMALGAERSSVTAMVMRSAAIQTGLGLLIGIPTALLCVRFVEAQLYEVKGVNAPVLLASIATLALAACVAGLIPARRAASTDPARALRTE
ncbi:MAG TPA: ABC transporter permease [Candidatus Sulfotelmatobacter sp.]|nr:ABC transporter permease [Candidatus Sulfotelmatobacter sp.]